MVSKYDECVFEKNMDESVQDISDPLQLSLELRSKSEGRLITWGDFFKKYENMSDNGSSNALVSYTLPNVPEYVGDEPAIHYSNKVWDQNLTHDEQKVVSKIQEDLKSNLNKLILQREKTKIFHYEGYNSIHAKVRKEIRKLSQFVTPKDIHAYICLCTTPNPTLEHFIENILHSELKETLRYQRTVSEESEVEFWNLKLTAEWNHLTQTLPEEDVVIYAVNVITENCL